MFGMQRLNKLLRSKSKGFMLAEAMFSLFITMMVLLILQNLLLSVKKANLNQNQHVNEVAYAYVQLENFMRADKIKAVYPVTKLAISNSASFKCIDQKGDATTYRIEYYKKNVLKVSGAGKAICRYYLTLKRLLLKPLKIASLLG